MKCAFGDTLGVNSARRAVSRRTMQIFDTRVLWNAKCKRTEIYILTSAETAIPSGH